MMYFQSREGSPGIEGLSDRTARANTTLNCSIEIFESAGWPHPKFARFRHTRLLVTNE
jgi:hypothetical protein